MKKVSIILVIIMCFVFCFACKSSPQEDITGDKDDVEEEEVVINDNDFKLNDSTIILKKEKNEPFNVLNLTDTQVSSDDHFDTELLHYTIKKLVEEQKPNLITLTGDYVWTGTGKKQFMDFVELMESFNIPWAPVMGNHDGEPSDLSEEQMSEIFTNAKNCLYIKGDSGVSGYGNYVINIVEKDDALPKKGKIINTLIMMDSGDNSAQTPNGDWSYGYITDSQIEWYKTIITKLKAKTALSNPKSFLFFHIPLKEMQDAYDMWEASGYDSEIGFGEKNENIMVSSYNSGFFDVIKEQGSTTHILYGHDHINNFGVKYEGIWMIYALKTADGCSWRNYLSGGTLISLSSHDVKVEHKYIDPYKENLDVVYFVNCGLVGEIPKVGENMYSFDKAGRLQTVLDQDYSLDAKSGLSWGRVEADKWLYSSERGDKLGDDACKYYSLIWAKKDSSINYEFELPAGDYSVKLGFYERWHDTRYANITVNDNKWQESFNKYEKRYVVCDESLKNAGKISVSIGGVNGNDVSLSYIEIVKKVA